MCTKIRIVPSQSLIDVGGAQHQQEAAATADPRQQLGAQVRQHHAHPRLEGSKKKGRLNLVQGKESGRKLNMCGPGGGGGIVASAYTHL